MKITPTLGPAAAVAVAVLVLLPAAASGQMNLAMKRARDKMVEEIIIAGGIKNERVIKAMRERGVITRVKGDSILLAPPLVTTPEQIDRIIEVVGESIQAVLPG